MLLRLAVASGVTGELLVVRPSWNFRMQFRAGKFVWFTLKLPLEQSSEESTGQ